jgi:hypothetical protein
MIINNDMDYNGARLNIKIYMNSVSVIYVSL